MKPTCLRKMSANGRLFQLMTKGGQKLTGVAIFGDGEYDLLYFQVDEYTRVPAESVRDAERVIDYYFSRKAEARLGYCTADGCKYTEAVPHGEKPGSKDNDLRLVKTASGCKISTVWNKRRPDRSSFLPLRAITG